LITGSLKLWIDEELSVRHFSVVPSDCGKKNIFSYDRFHNLMEFRVEAPENCICERKLFSTFYYVNKYAALWMWGTLLELRFNARSALQPARMSSSLANGCLKRVSKFGEASSWIFGIIRFWDLKLLDNFWCDDEISNWWNPGECWKKNVLSEFVYKDESVSMPPWLQWGSALFSSQMLSEIFLTVYGNNLEHACWKLVFVPIDDS